MKLWLVSNIRLDASRGLPAPALQTLRTAAALAGRGHDVLLWCDEIAEGGPAWAEGELGRSFPDRLALRRASARGGPGEKRSAFGAAPDRMWNVLRGRWTTGAPDAVISRSPTVLRQLRSSWFRPGGTRLILELQYPEWSFLWRDWSRRHAGAGQREAAEALRRLREAEHEGYHSADGILYAARAHERLLDRAEYGGARRWIPSGCDAPETEIADGAEFDLGYVGSLAPDNGLEALIGAAILMEGRRVLVIGSGKRSYLERLEERARVGGAGDRIVFAGAQAAGEVRGWMRRCRVGVAPISSRCGMEKRRYASPLKLVEWMAAGVPVAASRVPSIVQHREAGEPIALFEPDRPESIAACLDALLGDAPRRSAMAREGLSAAGKRSFENRADLVTAFVEQACGRDAVRMSGHAD